MSDNVVRERTPLSGEALLQAGCRLGEPKLCGATDWPGTTRAPVELVGEGGHTVCCRHGLTAIRSGDSHHSRAEPPQGMPGVRVSPGSPTAHDRRMRESTLSVAQPRAREAVVTKRA